MKYLFSTLLVMSLISCSGGSGISDADIPEHIRELENLTAYPADVEPTHSIDLVPVQTFGDIEEPLLSTIAGAVVDDRDRVLLWDQSGQSSRLHAFNPDGSYHSQIGRSGQGPGEYQYIRGLHIKSGKLYLHDLSANRISIYSTEDFSFIEAFIPEQWDVMEQDVVSELRFSEYYPRNDGSALVSFSGSPTPENEVIPQKLLIVDSNGVMIGNNVIESSNVNMFMPNHGGGLYFFPLSFLGSTRQTLSENDEIYMTPSTDFLIEKYDDKGIYESAFYYPVSKARFDADLFFEDRYNSFDFDVKREIESALGFPEFWPALDQLRVDDENRTWAAVIVEDQEVYEWWVLEESGELLATFIWPRNQTIQYIKNGHVYTRETDEASGLQTIEKYRIELSDG